MKTLLALLAILLVNAFYSEAKAQFKNEKAPVYLTVQADNGSIKQKINEDGTITCIIKQSDVIRVLSIVLDGEDVTNQLENNKLTLPLLTENTTLEITFDSTPTYTQAIYNTIAMY